MNQAPRTIVLQFDSARNQLGDDKQLRESLSVTALTGRNLWVASDETTTIERLTTEDGRTFKNHATYALADFLDLPGEADEEVDVEGIACTDEYLWLVGSHSLKRKKPKAVADDIEEQIEKLSHVESEGNRYLLARIPLAFNEDGGEYELIKFRQDFGGAKYALIAAQLRGDKKGNALTETLRDDKHLAPFLSIPGKDNGFDIEGLAVAGARVFLGLRGPVLCGYACVLEIEVETLDNSPSLLELKKKFDGKPYRKHFLQLDGLGVRELCVDSADLIIIAGPAMDLDGPVAVFRWKDALEASSESLVARDVLEKLFDVPFGAGEDAGRDHAEGMALIPATVEQPAALLIVYDAPAAARKKGTSAVLADVFDFKS
jgi:hypothetical protein